MEKRYAARYNTSLMKNSQTVKDVGLTEFMAQQHSDYTCPVCGGVISIHDAECSECQTKADKKR